MKKSFVVLIILLLNIGILNAEENRMKATALSNIELNYNYSSQIFLTGVNVNLVFDELQAFKALFQFGNFTIKPYVGTLLLPTYFNFSNKPEFAGLFGGFYFGLNGEYNLSGLSERQKMFVGIEKWITSIDARNVSLKAGYKHSNIYGGIKFNYDSECNLNSYGIFGGYDSTKRASQAAASKKIAGLIVDLFNAGYDLYVNEDERGLRNIKPGDVFYLIEALDEIGELQPEDIWYIIEEINKRAGKAVGKIGELIIVPTIQLTKNLYFMKAEYDSYYTALERKIELREQMANELTAYMWNVYDYFKNIKDKN